MLFKQHVSMYETGRSGNVELLERARRWGAAQYDVSHQVSDVGKEMKSHYMWESVDQPPRSLGVLQRDETNLDSTGHRQHYASLGAQSWESLWILHSASLSVLWRLRLSCASGTRT